MTDTYNTFKDELLQISDDLSVLLSDAKSVPGMSNGSFGDWKKTCADIRRQMSEEMMRVAVVGTIKSGKSTFVNSLFKGDYLKRGAGVVTSIVTRIRKGASLKAELWFKSYDEVNADMEQAMVLFPCLNWRSENDGFDIRQEEDRAGLGEAIENLSTDQLISNDTRSMNSVLLASYLEGYERVKETLSLEEKSPDFQSKPLSVVRYEGDIFPEHRTFVADDALAVYLKDVQLEISSGSIEGNVEIADCQGSDSPNPLHLAMIQEYLLTTHFIIYVISSRTGLRQADIKFLSIIKKMGIIDNILFIINFDFNEHDSPDDLSAVVEKIKAEISLIKREPEIYTLSALFNLFKSQGNQKLSPKDRQRLSQWEKETAFSDFSDKETERFESDFHHKLAKERYSLLLKNHLERLGVISSGTAYRIGLNRDILSKDVRGAGQIIKKIRRHQKKMKQIKSMTESTLDGTVKKMKHTLRADIDRFFDNRSGRVLGEVLKFAKDYNVAYYKYEENLDASNFGNTMYLVFQEFKQAVDTFMAEDINPEIIRFIREKEKNIREQLESVTGPYDVMVADALVAYNKTMERFGIPPIQEHQHRIDIPDMELVKRTSGLKLPPLSAPMRYTAKIKTEAVMRFGFYSFIRLFKEKILKRSVQNSREGELLALKNGVSRIKQETEGSIIFHFKDYRENTKFQYLFKLADALSDILRDILLDRFQAYITDLSNIAELIGEKQVDREDFTEILGKMETVSSGISKRIDSLRTELTI